MDQNCISLYVHLPFCRRRCFYCDFTSYTGNQAQTVDYLEALKKELWFYQPLLSEREIKTFYFGGGTPSLVEPKLLSSFFSFLYNKFRLSSKAEITLEANPESVDRRKLKIWRQLGINRLSLGFQSLNQRHLKTLGRTHTVEDGLRTYQLARQAGFINISADLIFGIPGETVEEWQKTLAQVVDLSPEHLSIYALTLRSTSRLFKKIAKDKELKGFDDESQAQKYELALTFLKSSGFIHYEISNFARAGFECQHNLNYWNRGDYLGLGCSAASLVDNCRWINYASFKKYLEQVFKGKRPVKSREFLKSKEIFEEKLFLGLRLIKGVLLDSITGSLGASEKELFYERVSQLKTQGFLKQVGDKIALNQNKIFLADYAIRKLLG